MLLGYLLYLGVARSHEWVVVSLVLDGVDAGGNAIVAVLFQVGDQVRDGGFGWWEDGGRKANVGFGILVTAIH